MTMLEVLITLVILMVGLLGLASLQARMQLLQMETYQRTQAAVLLQMMTDQIGTNRINALDYVTAQPLGTGQPLQDCSGQQGAARHLCQWSNLLLGAAEVHDGERVGAMLGARGCVINVEPEMPRKFMVAVVWQGMTPTAAPEGTTCGQGQYGDDRLRRAAVSLVRIGCLQNDPDTGACVTP